MIVLLLHLAKMLLFMSIGFFLSKRGLIKRDESGVLGRLLLYVVLPGTIINSFQVGAVPNKLPLLLVSVLCGSLALMISMLLSAAVFQKDAVANFAAAFCNAGFMGIPLITAVLGSSAVFYIAGMVALLNALQWTYGQAVLSGKKSGTKRELLKNPMVLAFFAGVLVYGCPITLPSVFRECLSGLAACNTPLAMIVLGLFLGESDLRQLFTRKSVYAVSAVRLLIIPAATFLLLWALPFDPEIRLAVFIAACAPAGSNAAIYAQKFEREYTYAANIVCCSTLLSVMTLPAWIAAAAALW